MRVVHSIAELRRLVAHEKSQGKRVGIVPTMGNLHAGHLKLVETALQQAEFVICTLFVNPLQFGPQEDLAAYPRTPDQDMRQLQAAGCHCLFAPAVSEMYPAGPAGHTTVSVPGLGERLCGRTRPGHFDGVATVVSKLFNICQPDSACFGLKDYQQFLVVSRMVADLCLPIRLIGVETVREPNGLAMSSRNNYLSAQQKDTAAALYRGLTQLAAELQAGARDFARLEADAVRRLQALGLRPDYVAICNAATLAPAATQDTELALLVAAFLGSTRLIDNIRISLSPSPQGETS